ncbi:hypothetical protein RYX36_032196 [Vicia faba]
MEKSIIHQFIFRAVFDRATFQEGRVELYLKKQYAADTLDHYSRFVIARVGARTQPCDLRLHLMKEISGMPTSLNRERTRPAVSPETTSESSSSSGTEAVDTADSFLVL